MNLAHLAPAATSPALTQRAGGDWSQRAACAEALETGLDLAQLTTETETTTILGTYTAITRAGNTVRDYYDDVEAARVLCSTCPVLEPCRARALLHTDIAGVVAGLTETERTAWRLANGITVDQLRLAVLVPDDTGHIVLDLSTETRATGQHREITGEELVAVMHLTATGWTASTIADRLITVRSNRYGHEEAVSWTIHRVHHAREILLGRGKARRRPA
jgi:hypothetical protein